MIRSVLKRGTKFSMEIPGHITKMTRAERRTQCSESTIARAWEPVGGGVAVRGAGREGADSSVGQSLVLSPMPSTQNIA